MKLPFSTLAAALLLTVSQVSAHDYQLGDVRIDHPWTRATLPNAPVAGGYMTIVNNGSDAVTLTGGSTSFAETVEIHLMEMVDGVMRMEQLPDGLTIEPGQTVELAPGSYHIMMTGLNGAIEEDAMVPLTLEFDGNRTVDVELAAEAVGATEPGSGEGSMEGMDHGDHRSGHDH